MFAKKTFFSVMGVTDPTRHREYNEYHQLDHRPENLLLPGVAWGDRWVRSPDCVPASKGSDRNFDDAHYVAMYWLYEPLQQSLKQWTDLGELAWQWGRRPDMPWRKNHFQKFMDPLKGYVAPRVLVSHEALVYRPVRGMHFTLSRFRKHDAEVHETLKWYDRVRFPDLLSCRGVAGAWSFVTEDLLKPDRDTTSSYDDASWTRVTLLYLDEDPLDVMADIQRHDRANKARTRDTSAVEDVLFATPLRTIVPWQWDWFGK